MMPAAFRFLNPSLAVALALGVVACQGQNFDRQGQGEKLSDAAPIDTPAVTPAAEAHGPGDGHNHGEAVEAEETGRFFAVAGLYFGAPETWIQQPADGMRKASFRRTAISGDPAPAELNVFYFGTGQGGEIEANFRRWVGQMEEGAQVDRHESTNAAGLKLHKITAAGTFNESVGGPMSGNTTARENWRLVGAIVEGPEGNVFLKLTGPAASAMAMEAEMDQLLAGATKG